MRPLPGELSSGTVARKAGDRHHREENCGSPGIPVVTGQNSLSRRARPLEILGRPLNDVLFSREFRESQNCVYGKPAHHLWG
jgi:hypothetical protein